VGGRGGGGGRRKGGGGEPLDNAKGVISSVQGACILWPPGPEPLPSWVKHLDARSTKTITCNEVGPCRECCAPPPSALACRNVIEEYHMLLTTEAKAC